MTDHRDDPFGTICLTESTPSSPTAPSPTTTAVAPVVPIPGTTKLAHLDENLRTAEATLTPAEVQELEAAVSKIQIWGDRPLWHLALLRCWSAAPQPSAAASVTPLVAQGGWASAVLPLLAGVSTNALAKDVVARVSGGPQFAKIVVPGLVFVTGAIWLAYLMSSTGGTT
ncbi:hypothetical protein [Pandoraea fibrosis]|uniref:Putative transmembrane protein n=1 Tax=Pandoraea fibrosis TaxID=1891094 RepID=A0A5E4S7L3_9BURK|nr:hypothetical protein [Pandoraea fibrosis]VVD70198.1 putative transmembrane protein [Pandoraea fibrosis]